ncbi:MAG TPA: hypothetical protein VKA15_04665 [Isosphaeraceae bacterium]|nr:hypothetical protein [Isosphaeraceae bacterium]
MTKPSDDQPMRKLEFIGSVRSNQGAFSQEMVIPGRQSLVLAPDDWPATLTPGTLNIAIHDDGFPIDFEQLGKGDGLKKLDERNFRPELAIPPWRIVGNTLQPTPDEPVLGSAQVWRAELEVASTGEVATCWMLRRLGSDIVSQIELVSDEHLRRRLNLCDGMVVKVTVWEAESKFKPKTPSEAIADWCEATAGRIEPEFGTEKAMGYLIGEKFLNFLEVAESNNEWREAIPEFVGAIKSLFEPWQLAQFLKAPRRLGALGHAGSEEAHRAFREAMEESERVQEDARNLMLLSWAEELLLPE